MSTAALRLTRASIWVALIAVLAVAASTASAPTFSAAADVTSAEVTADLAQMGELVPLEGLQAGASGPSGPSGQAWAADARLPDAIEREINEQYYSIATSWMYEEEVQQILPAYRWSDTSLFIATAGWNDPTGSALRSTVSGVGSGMFFVAGFVWEIIVSTLEFALTANVSESAGELINAGFTGVFNALAGSGAFVIIAVLLLFALAGRALKFQFVGALRILMIVLLPVGALWGLGQLTANNPNDPLATGTPAWIAHKGVGFVDQIGVSLGTGFSLLQSTSTPVGVLPDRAREGWVGCPGCQSYTRELEVGFNTVASGGPQARYGPLRLSGPNQTLLTSSSRLWERAFLDSWTEAQYGTSGLGQHIFCVQLEQQNEIPPRQIDLIQKEASMGMPLSWLIPQPVEADQLSAYMSLVLCEPDGPSSVGRQSAWADDDRLDCETFSEEPDFSSDEFELPVVPEGPKTVKPADVAEATQARLNISNNADTAARQMAAYYDLHTSTMGFNSFSRAFGGIVAAVTSLAYAYVLTPITAGSIVAQFGFVLLMILLPVTLLLVAVPTKNQTRNPAGMALLKATGGFMAAKLALVLLLTLTMQAVLLIDRVVGAAPAGLEALIGVLVPVIALLLVRALVKFLGVGDIMTLQGAVGMSTAAGASAATNFNTRDYRFREKLRDYSEKSSRTLGAADRWAKSKTSERAARAVTDTGKKALSTGLDSAGRLGRGVRNTAAGALNLTDAELAERRVRRSDVASFEKTDMESEETLTKDQRSVLSKTRRGQELTQEEKRVYDSIDERFRTTREQQEVYEKLRRGEQLSEQEQQTIAQMRSAGMLAAPEEVAAKSRTYGERIAARQERTTLRKQNLTGVRDEDGNIVSEGYLQQVTNFSALLGGVSQLASSAAESSVPGGRRSRLLAAVAGGTAKLAALDPHGASEATLSRQQKAARDRRRQAIARGVRPEDANREYLDLNLQALESASDLQVVELDQQIRSMSPSRNSDGTVNEEEAERIKSIQDKWSGYVADGQIDMSDPDAALMYAKTFAETRGFSRTSVMAASAAAPAIIAPVTGRRMFPEADSVQQTIEEARNPVHWLPDDIKVQRQGETPAEHHQRLLTTLATVGAYDVSTGQSMDMAKANGIDLDTSSGREHILKIVNGEVDSSDLKLEISAADRALVDKAMSEARIRTTVDRRLAADDTQARARITGKIEEVMSSAASARGDSQSGMLELRQRIRAVNEAARSPGTSEPEIVQMLREIEERTRNEMLPSIATAAQQAAVAKTYAVMISPESTTAEATSAQKLNGIAAKDFERQVSEQLDRQLRAVQAASTPQARQEMLSRLAKFADTQIAEVDNKLSSAREDVDKAVYQANKFAEDSSRDAFSTVGARNKPSRNLFGYAGKPVQTTSERVLRGWHPSPDDKPGGPGR